VRSPKVPGESVRNTAIISGPNPMSSHADSPESSSPERSRFISWRALSSSEPRMFRDVICSVASVCESLTGGVVPHYSGSRPKPLDPGGAVEGAPAARTI